MLTISDTPSSWTSLSDLLSPDQHPQWLQPSSFSLQLKEMIEQNKLLKSIKEKIKENERVKGEESTIGSICWNEEEGKGNRSSSGESRDQGFRKKINRSFQSGKSSSTTHLIHRPIRRQLQISEYQKCLSQIHHSLSSQQFSILQNLAWQLKQSRLKFNHLKSTQLLHLSQLSLLSSTITSLQQQLKISQNKLVSLESSVKLKQKQLYTKQKLLTRFEMTLFLKEKMLFQERKIVNGKSVRVEEMERRMEGWREEVEGMWERIMEDMGQKEGVLGNYKRYLGEHRKSMVQIEKQVERQHQYLMKLIGDIQTIKLVGV